MSVVAMTRVRYDDYVKDEVIDLGQQAVKIFEQQPGFVSLQRYRSRDRNEIVTLIEWESECAYTNCNESHDWLLLIPQWCALQEEGDVEIDTRLLDPLGTGKK